MKKRIMAAAAVSAALVLGSTAPAFAVDPSPAIATLTGSATIGQPMTVAFNDSYTIYGNYFDIWACPNKDVLPIDLQAIGDCVKMTFWERGQVASYDQQTTARSMKWVLSNESVDGLNPSNDQPYLDGSGNPIKVDPPESDNGWCDYAGWYIIINDYDGYNGNDNGQGHSNWSDAISASGCTSAAPEASSLPNTGVNTATIAGVFGAAAAFIAAGLLFVARRRRANV